MFANLTAILEAAGSGLERVLTANIYLTDSDNYAAFNEVYTRVCFVAAARCILAVVRLTADTVDVGPETAEDVCLCERPSCWCVVRDDPHGGSKHMIEP